MTVETRPINYQKNKLLPNLNIFQLPTALKWNDDNEKLHVAPTLHNISLNYTCGTVTIIQLIRLKCATGQSEPGKDGHHLVQNKSRLDDECSHGL